MKPSIFIGSSQESLEVAYAFQKELEFKSEVTVWSQGIFKLSVSFLDNLLETLDKSDFGIFILSPEDILTIRNKQYLSARDNVIFELGLFIGRLGKERTFMVIPSNCESLHLPTDLNGIVTATYDSERHDKNIIAAIGPACFQIRNMIGQIGIRKKRITESNIFQVSNPKVLCAASSQYSQLGFERDINIMSNVFDDRCTYESNLTSERIRDLLLYNEFDIIHLVLFLNTESGDLVFNDINLENQENQTDLVDSLSIEAFASLIQMSKTSLVVFATCYSLLPTLKLSRHTNLITTTQSIEVNRLISWEKCFYEMIGRGSPLSSSFDIATMTTKAPMQLIMKNDLLIHI